MNVNVNLVGEQVNAFWNDYGYVLIAESGAMILALVVLAAVKVLRAPQRDRWVGGLTALVVLAWTSEGLWEVAYFTLGLPLGFAVMTFFVYEAMMLTSALQAERHRRRHPSPGPAGRYVWVLATITASIVALNAATLVEAMLRFTLPLAAAGLWWVGITAEREDDPADVQQLREQDRQRRDAIWAINPRQLLVAAGIMRPGTQTLTDAERERRIRQMVAAADRLHASKPDSRSARRALRRLRRLARLASANDITAVRARVARATHIAELVLPDAGASPGTGGTFQDDARSAEAAASASREPVGVTTPYQRNRANGHVPVSRNGHHAEAAAKVRGSGRANAERLYRESVQAGVPLTNRELAARSGCSPTTAWRGIKLFQASAEETDQEDAAEGRQSDMWRLPASGQHVNVQRRWPCCPTTRLLQQRALARHRSGGVGQD